VSIDALPGRNLPGIAEKAFTVCLAKTLKRASFPRKRESIFRFASEQMDSRFRGNDGMVAFAHLIENVKNTQHQTLHRFSPRFQVTPHLARGVKDLQEKSCTTNRKKLTGLVGRPNFPTSHQPYDGEEIRGKHSRRTDEGRGVPYHRA
jgi:hypothetical protein